ncbi:hypothetical protein Sya03_55780 [Spirilliplanes yamanashiensis]|uniref:Uncharacterized protein n=1 Tax=Spirilliplanes yamanashiensis TaxID=42233 RepID=A0A8J3YCI2_9ACTN|nr:hypothetical protein Sya03_55780 [Spirilliplanes yamanashiensis]
MPDEATYALELAVTDWLSISGDVIEEELRLTHYAFDIGDDEEVETKEAGVIKEVADLMELGRSIRDVGSRQLPDWPTTGEGMQTWPAPERTEVFAFTARQWGMAIHGLEHWAEVSERVGHTESAADGRRLAALLRDELGARGLSQVPDPSRTGGIEDSRNLMPGGDCDTDNQWWPFPSRQHGSAPTPGVTGS